MPTGYTYKITEGCSFEEYAKSTMRAMGACIMLRDEDSSVEPTPENVNYRSDHCQKKLDAAISRSLLSKDEILIGFSEYKADKIEILENDLIENQKKIKCYTDMLDKCLSFDPPTLEHEGWKEFMVKQIEDSIKWDCSYSYIKKAIHEYKLLTPDAFVEQERESIDRDIAYYTKQKKKDAKSNNDRSAWVELALKAIKENKQ